MKASYKFARTKSGNTAFAQFTIDSAPAPEFSLRWNSDLAAGERIYGHAVREAVLQAARWHADLGGGQASFTVMEFVQLPVDTREDAVRCAAAAAAWIALGHPESELTFDFDNTWRVRQSGKE